NNIPPYSAVLITYSQSNIFQLLNTNDITRPYQSPNSNNDGSSSDSTTKSIRNIQ
ncbi:4585_t:CDS:1, partial [Cetraspora pellucida]